MYFLNGSSSVISVEAPDGSREVFAAAAGIAGACLGGGGGGGLAPGGGPGGGPAGGALGGGELGKGGGARGGPDGTGGGGCFRICSICSTADCEGGPRGPTGGEFDLLDVSGIGGGGDFGAGEIERPVGTAGGGVLGIEGVGGLVSDAVAGGHRAVGLSACTSGFSVITEFAASGGGAERF